MGADREKLMIVVIKEEYSTISRAIIQRQELYCWGYTDEIKALEWAKKCRPFPEGLSPEDKVIKIWTERRDED